MTWIARVMMLPLTAFAIAGCLKGTEPEPEPVTHHIRYTVSVTNGTAYISYERAGVRYTVDGKKSSWETSFTETGSGVAYLRASTAQNNIWVTATTHARVYVDGELVANETGTHVVEASAGY